MPLVEISPDRLDKIAAEVLSFADSLPRFSAERKRVEGVLTRDADMVALFIDLALSKSKIEAGARNAE